MLCDRVSRRRVASRPDLITDVAMILLGRCEIVRLTPRIVAVNPCEALCQCQLSLMDTVISAGRFPFSHLKPGGEWLLSGKGV